ncbi:MAG: glycosyltransferase family 2 protein [Hydrogenimonas sp.]|nr:glycosyltransferase family 2 protein [Hydrogenimonas sp.]
MVDISVIILTYNEEKHIERCIESLRPFAKRVIIIDSCSIDQTVEIARSMGADVYSRKWPGNHAQQFQWGLDNTEIDTEWIMKIDADEFVLPELAEEISQKLPKLSEEITGIYIKRRVFFMGKWIKYGGYYPTWLLRVWRRDKGVMEQRWMDEHIKLTDGKAIRFEHDFVDDNLNGLTAWIQKHNDYATKEAAETLSIIYGFKENEDSVAQNIFGTQEERKRWLKTKYVSMPLFVRPALYFVYRYFLKAGFLDGKEGLIWHTLQGGWYRFLVDAKIFEIYHKAGREKSAILDILSKEHGIDLKKDC